MLEQYTFEGVTYNVAANRLEDFLAKYPGAVKVEEPGKTQDTTVDDAPAVSVDTESASEPGSSESVEIFNINTPDPERRNSIQHITIDDIRGTSGSSKTQAQRDYDGDPDFEESNLVSVLTNHYDKVAPGQNIRFVEAKGGQDAVEILIGDQEPGEGQTFDFDGGFEMAMPGSGDASWWKSLFGTNEKITNEDQFESMRLHIETSINPEAKNDMLDVASQFLTEGSYGGGYDADAKERFIKGIVGDEAFEARGTGEGDWANMEGSLDLGPEYGDIKVPYKYLWDNRDELRLSVAARNDEELRLEIDEQSGEGAVYLDPNNPLTGVRTEGAYKYREDQVRPLLENAFEADEEIMRLSDLIKTGTVGVLKEGDEGYDDGLKALHARFNTVLQERGIVPLWKNDDPSSGLIDITRSTELLHDNMSKEEAEFNVEADLLARNNPQYDLQEMALGAYARLVNSAQAVMENEELVLDTEPFFAYGFDKIIGALVLDEEGHDILDAEAYTSDSPGAKRDLVGIGRIANNRNLDNFSSLPLLNSKIAENVPAARAYNEAVNNLLVLSKAVDLNRRIDAESRDSYGTEVMGDFASAFRGDRVYQPDARPSKETEEVFRNAMHNGGFVVPRTYDNKRIGEGAAQVVTDMAPLLLEIAAFNKVAGGAKLTRFVGGNVTKALSAINGGSKSIRAPRLYSALNSAIGAGVATTVEWTAAETIGEKTLGWKAQTIDFNTGETRFTMPFVMGMSGTVFGVLQNGLKSQLMKNPYVGGVVERFTDTSLKTIGGSTFGKILKPFTITIGKGAGQGATATALLTGAELGQMNIDSLLKKGRRAEAEEMAELFDSEHLMNTFIAMSVLSGKKVVPEFKEAVRQSVQRIKFRTAESNAASKRLGGIDQVKGTNYYNSEQISKGANAEKKKIDAEDRKGKRQIKKDLDAGRISETDAKSRRTELNNKRKAGKKEIDNSVKELELHNNVLHTQRAARKQGKYNEYLRSQVNDFNILRGSMGLRVDNLTDKQLDRLSKLDHGDVEMMLYMEGVEPGSPVYSGAVSTHEILRDLTKLSDQLFVGEKSMRVFEGSKRREFIQNRIELLQKEAQIAALQEQIKKNPNDGALKLNNDGKIIEAKKEAKELREKSVELLGEHREAAEAIIEAELAAAKIIAEKVGVESDRFKVLTDAEYKDLAKKEGFDPDSEAFYDSEKQRVVINKELAAQMGSFGVGVHEAIHHILKDSLKSVDKYGQRFVDADGMKIVNQFLESLPKKTRALIDKRLNENYKFKEFTKAEYNKLSEGEKSMFKDVQETEGGFRVEIKEEYYKEEAVTAFSDLLKEKVVTYEKTVGQKVQDLFFPIINKVFPNAYKAEGTRSIKAGEDLYKLVTDMYETSEAVKLGKKVTKDLKVSESKEVGGKGIAEARKRIRKPKSSKVEQPSDIVNKFAEGVETKAEWLESNGFKKAVDALKPGGVIYNRIADKSKGLSKEKIAETVKELRSRLINFDPQAKRRTGSEEPITFDEFVNANIGFGKLVAAKELFKQSEQASRTKRIDQTTSEGKQLFELEADKDSRLEAFENMDLSVNAQTRRAKLKEAGKSETEGPRSKVKKLLLKNNKLANPEGSVTEFENKFKASVQKAVRTGGYLGATAKNKPFVFRDNLEKTFENDMFKDVKNALGTRKVYEDFIRSKDTFDIIKDVDMRQLIKAKMDFAYEKVIDPKTGKQQRMSTEEMREAGYPERYDFGAAPGKFREKNFTQQDFIDWAEGKGMAGSTKGTRKDAIARIFSIEGAKDAMPTALRNPFVEALDRNGKPILELDGTPRKINLLEDLNSKQVETLMLTDLKAQVLDVVNRNPNLQFSKKTVSDFNFKTKDLSISEVINELKKTENSNIKDIYDTVALARHNMEFIPYIKSIRDNYYDSKDLYELKLKESDLKGEMEDVRVLKEMAVTEAAFKDVSIKFNLENKSNQISLPGKISGFDAWTMDPKQLEVFQKEYGEILDLLPSWMLSNKQIMNTLITTGGQGKIFTRIGKNSEGNDAPRVQRKDSGNLNYQIENYGKELKGIESKTPIIENNKGKKVPLTDAFKVTNTGTFKKEYRKFQLKNQKLLEQGREAEYLSKLKEFANDKIAKKGFTFEQTYKANQFVRNSLTEAIVKRAFEQGVTNAERTARFDAIHKLLQIQTNIGNGAFKGLNTIRYIDTSKAPSLEGIEYRSSKASGYHAEHAFFNLAHTATVSKLLSKYNNTKGSQASKTEKFIEEYKKISLDQYIIPETLRQMNEGAQIDPKTGEIKEVKGNTEFEYLGNVYPELNVLANAPRKAFEMFDVLENKFLSDRILDNLKTGGKAAKKLSILAESLDVIKQGKKTVEAVDSVNEGKLVKSGFYSKKSAKDLTFDQKKKALENINKAFANARKADGKKKGMSTFDFDETVGVSENFVIATKGGETKRIASHEWPFVGENLVKDGWKMDFSDFNKVTKGKPGPLMTKLKNQISKFGPNNVFILTARAQESAPAIHEWLKTQGVNIPIKNITGLGNSAGEAKAAWMVEKYAEGYNDMYFVDDAIPNVKAVKKALDQLDIKSKVRQALYSKKQSLDVDLNKILEHSLGIDATKKFSKAEGRMRGQSAKRRKIFLPDSASDLSLLLEPLYGKGAEGIKNKEWFNDNFYRKFERGINDYNTAKQRISNEYMALRKSSKDVVKDLSKDIPDTSFSHDMGVRIYIWDKAGFKIPDLAETTKNTILEYIEQSPKFKAYAESVSKISGIETGLREPTSEWWAETIATELSDANRSVGRKEYLADFIEAREQVFSEVNLNKMESKLGKDWRENIEDMFQRMESGRSRSEKLTGITGDLVNYLNGSVGAIMNFNTRSATLQLLSTVNFVNATFNNPARAAQAFANQPQYWKDFMTILNSDMLKLRRDGLQINVTEAELASAAKGSKNPVKAVMAKIIKAGYLPTKFADSFAIAAGGAKYYRNSIRKYTKQGMSKAEAEKKAFLDFQAIAERTQQSNRPDLISREQTTLGGRLILPFANTPMQMNRLAAKEILDISKGRYKNKAELTEKLGKIGYYGFVQTAIFAGLSSSAFALMMNSEDEDAIKERQTRARDGWMDSTLRGMGIKGAVLNGVVNSIKEFSTQSEKGFGADYSEVAEDLLSISPPIGSKFRKLDQAGNIYKYNRKEIDDKGVEFNLDSPGLEASLLTTEAITNVPVHRFHRKASNLRNLTDSDFEVWQKVLMALGWSEWDVAPGVAKDKANEKKGKTEENEKKEKKVKIFNIAR